jgi:hypothetical protein
MVLLNEHILVLATPILLFVASCPEEVCSCAISHTVGLSFADHDDEVLDSTAGKYYKKLSCTSSTKTYTQARLYNSASFNDMFFKYSFFLRFTFLQTL